MANKDKSNEKVEKTRFIEKVDRYDTILGIIPQNQEDFKEHAEFLFSYNEKCAF